MTDIVAARNNSSHAAQQAVITLIEASGAELFRNSGVSEDGGKKAAEFLIAFHKTLTAYYKEL